jgi:short-subunit dehydrogenase
MPGAASGKAFLDQNFDEVRRVIDTNVTGTVYLIQEIARDMRSRNSGRVLIVGSIAGYVPGPFQAIYHGTKAFIDSFSFALRNELNDTEVSVTCLMPGATETAFFERADLMDTKVGQMEKDDAGEVAKVGFDAMMEGQADVVSGWHNKIQTMAAGIVPGEFLAARVRRQTEPGSGTKLRAAWPASPVPLRTLARPG